MEKRIKFSERKVSDSNWQRLLKRFGSLVFLAWVVGHTLQGQTLEEYVQLALENNLELKAYDRDYQASLETVSQSGVLPDPEFSAGVFPAPMDRLMGRQHADLQLMQSFPWFGTLGTQKEVANQQALATFQEFRGARNQLIYRVKSAWYQLYRRQEEIRITEAHAAILNRLERLALVRFQSQGATVNPAPGSGRSAGMSGVLRLKMEINELETSLANLKSTQQGLIEAFNQLLNRDPGEAVSLPDTLPATNLPEELTENPEILTGAHPRLKQLEATESALQYQTELRGLKGKPMMGAGISYMPFSPRLENGMPMGGRDMVMPMVKISLPIYRKKYQALQQESKYREEAIRQRKENTGNELLAQWSQTRSDWENAERSVALYQEQIRLANQTLELLTNAYANNEGDFEALLETQRKVLDYRFKLLATIVDLHLLEARFENLAGL
ncbi:TolC family protein [Cyclobacterium xiamenense]|uniref:TolC family protein n=1 Tax=Cyclobacterium xiamenense TaxID=1297121 RepID=UPI0012B83F9E|nr:TolC family protein [Cyclobacterium xiamenense]